MPVITRRRFLRTLGVALGGVAGAGIYACGWEPHWVQVVDRKMPIANLPRDLAGRRLVQLSDLHIGRWVDDDYLVEVFDRVRELSPDFVVYTGDFTSYDKGISSHVDEIAPKVALGKVATVGVLGNHDFGPNWQHPEMADGLIAQFKKAGIQVLSNEVVESKGLQIVGVDDLWGGRFDPEKALKQADPNGASVVLSHNPDTADNPGWGNYQGWILAGHTHGGQCRPPFLPAPILPVKNTRYQAGEYALEGGRRMYINRGIGHLVRARFNVRPEITQFHLERA